MEAVAVTRVVARGLVDALEALSPACPVGAALLSVAVSAVWVWAATLSGPWTRGPRGRGPSAIPHAFPTAR